MLPQAHYLIRINPDRAHALQKVLASLDINIDLRMDMIATGDRDLIEHSIISGSDIPHAAHAINSYLQDHHILPLLKETLSEWDLLATAEFLELAVTQFSWNDSRTVDYAVWEGNPAEWQALADQHPHLFEF